MGLRFRKSISIIPGVRVNFGMSGMSVSTGVPGFRKTFHTSGRVTTTKKNNNKIVTQSNTQNQIVANQPIPIQQTPIVNTTVRNINYDTIKSIHRTCDEPVDWTEILVNPLPLMMLTFSEKNFGSISTMPPRTY